jgi:nucleotide-binding universal stress UspA family protein
MTMSLPRRILACTDLSPAGNDAVAYAAQLAQACGAELIVAHLFNGYVMMQRELLREPAQRDAMQRRERLLEELRSVVGQLAPGRSIRCICEHADAHREIPNLAAREGADLIVLGRYGHGGFARFFMGSVTDAVVRNAGVPVLAVGDGARATSRAGDAQAARHSTGSVGSRLP